MGVIMVYKPSCIIVMWVKPCHKPPMTGNGKFIPPIKMVMTGEWCKSHWELPAYYSSWESYMNMNIKLNHIRLI